MQKSVGYIVLTSIRGNDGEFVSGLGLMVQGQRHADFPAVRVDGEVWVASEALTQGVVDDGVYTAVRVRR